MPHHISQLQAGMGDASDLQRPHEFNYNLLAASWWGCLGWVEGEQWGYCMVQLVWVGVFEVFFFALFISLRYTNISRTSASLFTVQFKNIEMSINQ